MRLLFLLVMGALSQYAFAQITIGHTDMPAAGDTLRHSVSLQFQQFDFTQTGEDYTWDFSLLQHQSQGLEEYNSVTSVNWLLGTFVFPASLAINEFIDLPLEELGINPQDLYSVYKNNSQHYTQEGFFFMYDGIPIPLQYSSTDKIYSFPLNFGNTSSNAYAGSINLGDTLSLTIEGIRINEADGWGTITTPYGSFDCLRIKSTTVESDSLYWEFLGDPLVIQTTIIQYKWLSLNEKFPILEASYYQDEESLQPLLYSIRYRDIYREDDDTIAPVADFSATKTEVLIDEEITLFNHSTPNHQSNNYQWSFFPAGHVSFHQSTTETSTEPTISFNQAGSYAIRLIALNTAGKDTLTRENYIKVDDPVSAGLMPAKENIKITVTSIGILQVNGLRNGPGIISIFDINGRLLIKQPLTDLSAAKVNIAHLNAGIYVLQVYHNEAKNDIYRATFIKP